MESDFSLDARNLLCPQPVMRTSLKIRELAAGQVLQVIATDRGVREDIPAWCKAVGHEFIGFEEEGDEIRAYIRKIGERA